MLCLHAVGRKPEIPSVASTMASTSRGINSENETEDDSADLTDKQSGERDSLKMPLLESQESDEAEQRPDELQ
jgi:hypothetical protein